MDKALISFHAISKEYSSRLLYKKVDAEIYPHQVVLLTGKNGTGKSTLLKIAAKLCAPSHGEVKHFVQKEEIAYLGHATFLYPQLSAVENLNFWQRTMRGTKLSEEDCLRVLKRVQLERFAHDQAGIFSRGMAQRLNIARILLQNPKLILLDEPSTGLDTDSNAILHQCIVDFAQKGAGILWVSHNNDEDKTYATHSIHIENKQMSYSVYEENRYKNSLSEELS